MSSRRQNCDPFSRRGENGRLDLGLRRVQSAGLLPDRRMPGEIFLRLSGARGAHILEPRPVTGKAGSLRRAGHNGARQSGGGPFFRGVEKSPGAFAMPIDEPGFEQQQMTGHARLRLAENGHQFAHRQFRLGQQRIDAQARLSPMAARLANASGKGRFCRSSSVHIYMNISLCPIRNLVHP